MFGLADLEKSLSTIGNLLERTLRIFLIGGCAMTFSGTKLSTKDIDVVLLSDRDIDTFRTALEMAGFKRIRSSTRVYRELRSQMIYRNDDGMQFDLFNRTVCRKLEVSSRMVSRSEILRTYGKLEVRLISPEDIFLFKGMTERERDLDDMARLAEGGLKWDVIRRECALQPERQIWELFLFVKLQELEESHGIRAPIKQELLRSGGEELVGQMFKAIIGTRRMSFSEISDAVLSAYHYSPSWTRKQLNILVERGILDAARSKRKKIYRLSRTKRVLFALLPLESKEYRRDALAPKRASHRAP